MSKHNLILKEEKATDSLFENVVFSMIKKFKLKKEYDVERPSWTVFNFRHKNKDAQFAITFDERGHGDFLYGDVLAFGDEKDDIFKYKTDEVKVDSYNIEKECSNIIADCLAFIDTNKKITIFESKKSARKYLKESIEDDVDKLNNLKNQINSYAIGRGKVPSSLMKQYKELIKKLGNLVIYSDNEDKWILNESKKSAKKSLREKLNDNGKVQYNDIYSCSLAYTVKVQVYDKNAYDELLEQDLVLYSKGVHEGNLNWDGFQDELSYLKDAFDYSDFSMLMSLQNGRLYIDIVSDKDGDTVMDMTIEAKFAQ